MSEPRQPRTIARLAQVVITDHSAADLPVLGVASSAFRDVPAVRGRMVKTVMGHGRRQSATAFDSTLGSLRLQVTIVILNGVVTGAFDGYATGWWGRRRLAARLRRVRPGTGPETEVPVLGPERAVVVNSAGRDLARRAGLSTVEADGLIGALVALLSGDAAR